MKGKVGKTEFKIKSIFSSSLVLIHLTIHKGCQNSYHHLARRGNTIILNYSAVNLVSHANVLLCQNLSRTRRVSLLQKCGLKSISISHAVLKNEYCKYLVSPEKVSLYLQYKRNPDTKMFHGPLWSSLSSTRNDEPQQLTCL